MPVVGVVVVVVVVVPDRVIGVVVDGVVVVVVVVVVVDGSVFLDGGEPVHSDNAKAAKPSNNTATAMPMFRQKLRPRGQLGILKAHAQLQRTELNAARRRKGKAGDASTT